MTVPTIVFLCSLFLAFMDHSGLVEACLSVVRLGFPSLETIVIGTSIFLGTGSRFGLNANPPFL